MPHTVRIAFDISENSTPNIDPASIRSISQGILSDNLYSRLVEFDLSGQIQAGITSKFYWHKNSLIFEFTDKVKTASGKVIDAEDAAISLRRLLKLGSNTHIDLKLFLCEIQSIDDVFKDCEAVKVENQKLILTLKDENLKPFLVPALASIDFGIIPKQQISRDDLSILSLSETSGTYFLHQKTINKWVLKPNTHYGIKATSPKEIHLININQGKGGWDLFVDNEVDVVSTLHTLTDEIHKKITVIPDIKISKTMDLKLFFIKFSPKALLDFSESQRLWMGNKFQSLMSKEYPLPLEAKLTSQFFLDVGFGHLTPEQEEYIKDLRKNANPGRLPRKFTFYFYNSLSQTFNVFRKIEELEIKETDLFPFMQPPEERLDVFMGTTDTAYEESLALLGYNFTQGSFGLNAEEGSRWMKKFMSLESSRERIALTQQLHFDMLKRGVTIPLFKAPYTAAARNGFSVKLSPLFATTHFSEISYDGL
ncbi:MAG: hypothetical protein AAGB31_05035 [Bdellovibrio sp.]